MSTNTDINNGRDTADGRDLFEAEVSTRGFNVARDDTNPNEYKHLSTAGLWSFWLTARESTRPSRPLQPGQTVAGSPSAAALAQGVETQAYRPGSGRPHSRAPSNATQVPCSSFPRGPGQGDEEFIKSAVELAKVKCVHPDAETTLDIGRAVLAALRTALASTGLGLDKFDWPNGCDRTIPRALRYLADNPRPSGGESTFNSAHLFQLAGEMEDATQLARDHLVHSSHVLTTLNVEAMAACVDARVPDEIRSLGWEVAAHHDYRIGGKDHTSWLFTKGDSYVKGDGETDAEALAKVRARIALLPTES